MPEIERAINVHGIEVNRSGELLISKEDGVLTTHSGKVSAEDAILSCEVFILEQEFLIDQPGDVRQQPSPFVLWHEEHPS